MDAKNKGVLAGLLIKPGQQIASYRVEWGQKTLSISSSQVLDRDGSEVGTVAVFRDFTKEAELERMKSAFVAMVSPDFVYFIVPILQRTWYRSMSPDGPLTLEATGRGPCTYPYCLGARSQWMPANPMTARERPCVGE